MPMSEWLNVNWLQPQQETCFADSARLLASCIKSKRTCASSTAYWSRSVLHKAQIAVMSSNENVK